MSGKGSGELLEQRVHIKNEISYIQSEWNMNVRVAYIHDCSTLSPTIMFCRRLARHFTCCDYVHLDLETSLTHSIDVIGLGSTIDVGSPGP